MHVLIKVAFSVSLILLTTAIAKRFPSLAGLIGVMPLTGALVMVCVFLKNNGDTEIMH